MGRRLNNGLYVLIAAIVCPVIISACTNDLKKIREISNREVNSPADTTRGVDVIYSDSAKVKAHVTAPLMLEYQASKDIKESYQLMPKGVKAIFYDNLKETGTIVADTAYYYQTRDILYLRKNVVITSAKGDVFTSSELTWDKANHKITTNKPFDVKMANGNIGHGTALETNEQFSPYTIQNQTGVIIVNRDLGQ